MGAEATLKMLLLGEDRSAGKALKSVAGEADKTRGGMSKFTKVATAGLLAVAGAAMAFGKQSVDAYKQAATESMQLARVTGMTITQASQLRFAGEETGVTFTALSTGMKTFGKNLGGAAGDAKKSAAMVQTLGFSFKDANGHIKPMADILPGLADKFSHMADGPAKTALAMKLFGRGGVDMIKTLNKGSDGLRELAAESDKTGNTISNTDAYKKQIAEQRAFHASITGLKIQLGQALMPILTAVSTYLAEHVGPAFTAVSGFVQKHGNIIRALVPIVLGLVAAVVAVNTAVKMWAAISKAAAVVTGLFATESEALDGALVANPIGLIVIAIIALVAGFVLAYKKITWFRNGVNVVWGFLKKLAAWFAGAFVTAFKVGATVFKWVMTKAGDAINWVKSHWKLLLAILTGPIGAAVIFIVSHFGAIKNAAGAAVGWVTSKFGDLFHFFSSAQGRINGLAAGMFNGIRNAFGSAINFIIDAWNNLSFTLPSVSVMGHKIGGFTLSTPNIPHVALASGGIVSRPTIALIGEAGPEAVVPLSGHNARRAGVGGGDIHITINGALDPIAVGKQVQKVLLTVKRTNGGAPLGLA